MNNSSDKVAGVILTVSALVAYVILALTNNATEIRELLVFITPFATYLLINGQIKTIEQRTDTIQKNTNGVLTAHVNTIAVEAARAAIAEKENQNG